MPRTLAENSPFLDGSRAALPVVLGYLTIGFAAGVVQRAAGLSVAETMLMALVLYAGAAQFAAASLIALASPPAAVIATVFFLNLRHLLLSAALAPHFSRLPAWKNALIGAQLTDETFVVASGRLREGSVPAAWMAGLNLSAYFSWAAGNLAGALLGEAVGNTRALAFDFALPALFAALLALQLFPQAAGPATGAANTERGRRAAAALAAGVLAPAIGWLLPGNWNIILATLIAASLGLALERWKSATTSS